MASSVFRDFALKGTFAKHSVIEGRELSSFVTEEKQNIFQILSRGTLSFLTTWKEKILHIPLCHEMLTMLTSVYDYTSSSTAHVTNTGVLCLEAG